MSLARAPFGPLAAVVLSALAGCAAPPGEGPGGAAFLERLPEGLAETAAPGQNMRRVIISPEDACYWFEYVGPVETTYLPLRTREGRPICTRAR